MPGVVAGDAARCAATVGYATIAAAVMAPFVDGDVDIGTLRRICDDAYATFRHPAVCPLVQIGPDDWLLELFHGPTLAFKDVALQLVGRLFDHVLGQRGERVTIIGATSGDTGSAAIDAVAGRHNVDIVVLYPEGRVSEVQRRQMTTVDAANVRTVAVEGTFDDCQDLVKAMFADEAFRAEHRLAAVNSINWARVMAQVVYYATATAHLGGGPVSFAVPTGNFGNVLSGWVARRMGLPIERLVIGSNRNDILSRFLHSGIMATSVVVPTLSPSMDIQVSSNFERLLFELNHRDGGMTAEQLHAVPGHRLADGRARPARRGDVGVRRRPGRRRRDHRDHRPHLRRHRHPGRPPHRGRPRRRRLSGRDPRRCRWSHWPPPTRPSSPTPWSGPPASDRRYQPIWPTSWTGPSAPPPCPNDLAKIEAFVAGA